ncbi:hypothetical protein CS542_08395 [Pedobacter sp. IW39]|nr:hypothetical protein CS542_08395 [Pedobacter sp. IW39]
MVMKLSELMSYLLYDTDNETICLIKEITYIKNYIDLESLRFEQPPDVNFEITGNCDKVYIPQSYYYRLLKMVLNIVLKAHKTYQYMYPSSSPG